MATGSLQVDPGTTDNIPIYSFTEDAVTKLMPRAVLNTSGGAELKGQTTMSGSLPVVLASDQTTLAVSAASLPLPTGAATSAKQPALGTAGSSSSDVLSVQGVASGTAMPISNSSLTTLATNLPPQGQALAAASMPVVLTAAQITTLTPVSTVTANAGSGNFTVVNGGTFAAQAAQTGTWTVQPGNTPNTSPWLVTPSPATSGGLSTFHLMSGGSTNAQSVKASAGQLYGWYVYNSNAAARKLAFHNTSGTPTAGSSVFFSLVIPPTSGANVFTEMAIPFSSGIGITTVTGLADSDNTAVSANDLTINLWYK